CGNVIETAVVGMDEAVDLAEGEELLARLEAQNLEHRIRPVDSYAREIPIPQTAAAAIERRIDTRAHHLVNSVGFARPARLPMKCETEDQENDTRCRYKCHRERRIRTPAVERAVNRLHGDQLSERRGE